MRCKSVLFAFVFLSASLIWGQGSTSVKGEPFGDAKHPAAAQKIPGTVYCAYYDQGGEGVAYHDVDAKNNGSGALNPADGTYLHEFRMKEGVDISFTKFFDTIDNSPFDKVQPPEGLLYVGWTEPGEWFNMAVDVAQAGTYSFDLLYTSNRGGSISLDLNGQPITKAIDIPTTFDAADPLAWRQWHHWNILKNAAVLDLPAGKNVLTVRVVTGGNMNLATLDFHKTK